MQKERNGSAQDFALRCELLQRKRAAQISDGSLCKYIKLVRVNTKPIARSITAGVRVHPGLPDLPVQGSTDLPA